MNMTGVIKHVGRGSTRSSSCDTQLLRYIAQLHTRELAGIYSSRHRSRQRAHHMRARDVSEPHPV